MAYFLIGPIRHFGYYFDIIKDAILVYRLQLSLGGLISVFTFYERFSSMVSKTSLAPPWPHDLFCNEIVL